jgi:hypothetical protein
VTTIVPPEVTLLVWRRKASDATLPGPLPFSRTVCLAWLGCIVLWVGCSGRTTEPQHPLIGTWELDPTLDPKWAARTERMRTRFPPRLGSDTASAPTSQHHDPPEQPMRITFQQDGTWIMEASVLGHPIREFARWRPSDRQGDTQSIELIDDQKSTTEQMTFGLVKPDVVRLEFKIGPMYYRRVR